MVGELFGTIYGKSRAENIAVDRLLFDGEKKRKKPQQIEEPENFSKNVEKYEKEYEELDRIYCDVLERCETNWLCTQSKDSIEHLLSFFLFKWGKMGRFLGYQGRARAS